MALPLAYENLLSSYKKRLTEEELPVAQRGLTASQIRQGYFGSPVSTEGQANLQAKFLSAIGEKEAELGAKGAEAELEESRFGRQLGAEESRFGRQLGAGESQFVRGLEEAQRGREWESGEARIGLAAEESRFGRQLGADESQFVRGLEEATRNRQFQAEENKRERRQRERESQRAFWKIL